jgi:ubiquinone/menaquinone biosynthesis C-methylase UbiE
MVPALFAPWASRLVQSAAPQQGERVLDVACGTGIVARHVAPRVGLKGKVIGIDLDSDMLEVARAVAEQLDLVIEWRQGRAEKLPFPDASFDLVLCQFGLMLFKDPHAALAGMHRVLARGGRCVLSVWQGMDRHPFYAALDEVSRRRLGTSGVQDMFTLGDDGELRRLLTEAGFQTVEIESVSMTAHFPDPDEFLNWEMDVDPAVIPLMQHLDTPARQVIMAAIRKDMTIPLQQVMREGQVVLPFYAHIAHVKR